MPPAVTSRIHAQITGAAVGVGVGILLTAIAIVLLVLVGWALFTGVEVLFGMFLGAAAVVAAFRKYHGTAIALAIVALAFLVLQPMGLTVLEAGVRLGVTGGA